MTSSGSGTPTAVPPSTDVHRKCGLWSGIVPAASIIQTKVTLGVKMSRRSARLLSVFGLAAASTLVATGSASAGETYNASCYAAVGTHKCAGGSLAARATYDDGTDRLHITDSLKDGHSAVVVYWPAGRYDLRDEVWASGGAGTDAFTTPKVLGPFDENDRGGFKACIGEYDRITTNRVILSCGSVESFWA